MWVSILLPEKNPHVKILGFIWALANGDASYTISDQHAWEWQWPTIAGILFSPGCSAKLKNR